MMPIVRTPLLRSAERPRKLLECTRIIPKRSLSNRQSTAEVQVTQHRPGRQKALPSNPGTGYDLDREATTQLVDDLMRYTRSLMGKNIPQHLIAFSGGVDSSLVAALVHQSRDPVHERVHAVLGVSPAVPMEQIDLAVRIADQIGVELKQVPTTEGQDETYLANAGRACLACKTHLYSTLQAIVQHGETHHSQTIFRLYNGTNADDMQDDTRLGLIAAREFHVQSPLQQLSKDKVRQAARHLGLWNWNYAASPCLRSRLALGVTATAQHLELMAKAERLVRHKLNIATNSATVDETTNLRVRLLAGNQARIEIDEPLVAVAAAQNWEDLRDLGDFANVSVKAFRSGSVARQQRNHDDAATSAATNYEEEPAAVSFG